MTGLDKILNEIQRDSEATVNNIISDAKKSAKAISDEIMSRAESKINDIKEETIIQEKNILNQAKSESGLFIKNAVLLKKQKIINDIKKETKQRLITLPAKDYFGFLIKILNKFAHKEKGEIILSQTDKERLLPEFKKAISKMGLTISDKSLSENGGFILVYGDILEKCTFDALINSNQFKIADIIANMIFS